LQEVVQKAGASSASTLGTALLAALIRLAGSRGFEGNLEAGDLEAGDLEVGDLEVGDLEAGDLEAGDLEVGDLEAGSRALEG